MKIENINFLYFRDKTGQVHTTAPKFRLASSPPTLLRCVKMTQLIQSNPAQKRSRNYPYRQRFENRYWKICFICPMFRPLSCPHHLRRGLLQQLWRQKTRRILSGQIGEQQFDSPLKVYINHNYVNFQFV